MHAVTVTNDLYTARNTLTQRLAKPEATATIKLQIGSMAKGDRAGLSLFKDKSAAIVISKNGSRSTVEMVTGMDLDQSLTTISNGTVQASAPISGTTIWLRAKANSAPSSDKLASFSYSTNGRTFLPLGGNYQLDSDWYIFLGYRFAIFNYATVALGGKVKVESYTVV